MKRQNLTLCLFKSLLKKAKIVAARSEKSLSELVGNLWRKRSEKPTVTRKPGAGNADFWNPGLILGRRGRLPSGGKSSRPGDKVFLDTNIILYAYDVSAGEKHQRAKEIVWDLWNSGLAVISTQVLQNLMNAHHQKNLYPVKSNR